MQIEVPGCQATPLPTIIKYPTQIEVQSNLSYPDSCYPGTSLNRALYFMLILQKLWAVQWVWPIIAYTFILYSEIQTTLSYGHPLIPRRPDKRGFTVPISITNSSISTGTYNPDYKQVHGLSFRSVLYQRFHCIRYCLK